jgi:hypothetical protein
MGYWLAHKPNAPRNRRRKIKKLKKHKIMKYIGQVMAIHVEKFSSMKIKEFPNKIFG